MLTQLHKVETFVNKLHQMVDEGTFDHTKHGMSLLDVKFHLLLAYCSKLCVYISMRAKGENVAHHELMNQLAICCWILDKLRSIQKQCQYSIDKLLDHAKKSVNTDSNNNNKEQAINDELSHKPDLDSLRPPDDNDAVPLSSMDIDAERERNDDGIYRPLKLNPHLMDTAQSQLTKQQERQRQELRKRVKNHDIYKSIREDITNLPTEEKFYLENIDRFADEKHRENKSKSRLKDMENYEEENFTRLKQTHGVFKKMQSMKRYKEASIGDNLDAFVSNLDKSYRQAQKLGDYEAGGNFNETIGKIMKKDRKLKGGQYIKGSWRKREKILFKKSKQGQKVESRKRWRKEHPLKTNPAKAARMKVHNFKKSGKVRKLLKKIK